MAKQKPRKTRLFRLEHKGQPVVARRVFARRVAISLALTAVVIGVSLAGGMCGYHYIEGLAWIDSFVNAAMILSGMGPLDQMKSWWGKLFAGCYAIYSGLMVIVLIGIVLGPPFHRLIHKFHADDEQKDA